MPMSVADRLPAALRLPSGMRASIAALQDAAAPAPAVLPAAALAHARTLGTRRSLEFLGARVLAAPLLDAAGFPGFALLPDADGSPAWPDGAWGSLSHSRGLAFVACGRRPGDALGFGIDLEHAERFGPRLHRAVLTPSERGCLAPDDIFTPVATFCAKEAFYKAQWPCAHLHLGFMDAEVLWQSPERHADGSLSADFVIDCPRFVQALPGIRPKGRAVLVDSLAAAWVSIARA